LIFNYSRNEGLATSLWPKFDLLGLRVSYRNGIRWMPVASMLYRDYLRPDGEWLANDEGGPRISKPVTLSASRPTPCLSQHFPGALFRSPKNHHLADGDPSPTHLGGPEIQPEVETWAGLTTCSINFELRIRGMP